MLTRAIRKAIVGSASTALRCGPMLARNIWSDAYKAKFTDSELSEKIERLRNFDRAEISRTITLSMIIH